MEHKVEPLENAHNKVNSIYFKCRSCGKLLLMIGSYLQANSSLNLLCSCDSPIIEDVFYINPKNTEDAE